MMMVAYIVEPRNREHLVVKSVKKQVVRVMEVSMRCHKNTRLQTAVSITIDYKMRRA